MNEMNASGCQIRSMWKITVASIYPIDELIKRKHAKPKEVEILTRCNHNIADIRIMLLRALGERFIAIFVAKDTGVLFSPCNVYA